MEVGTGGEGLEPTASTNAAQPCPSSTFSKSANTAPSASCDAPSTSSPAPTSKGGHTYNYNNPTAAPSSNLRLASTPARFPAHPWSELPNLAELYPQDPPPPLRQSPRVHTFPDAPIKVDEPAPVAHRTRACLKLSPLAAASSTFPSEFIKIWSASEVLHGNQWSPLAISVLDPETGQSLEHRALRRHPRLGPNWNTSYSNEVGRLCQALAWIHLTPPSNVWKAQTPSTPSGTRTSP